MARGVSAAKDFTFVLGDIEQLVNACQLAFGPDDDPDHHWPDEEDVSHPPTGITFGMIRRARLAVEAIRRG